MPTRASCGLQTGMGCPGWPFCRAFPQHAPSTPLRPTPHPSTLAHPQPCSHLPSHLCPRPGTAAKPAAPGCGLQPAGETQGAGATVAADRAPQGEDRGAGFVPSPPTSPHAELVSPLPHRRRPKAHLSLFCAQLCLEGNPLWFHPEHRVATARYLSPRARDAAAGVSVCPCLLRLPFPARPPSLLHTLAFPHIPW